MHTNIYDSHHSVDALLGPVHWFLSVAIVAIYVTIHFVLFFTVFYYNYNTVDSITLVGFVSIKTSCFQMIYA